MLIAGTCYQYDGAIYRQELALGYRFWGNIDDKYTEMAKLALKYSLPKWPAFNTREYADLFLRRIEALKYCVDNQFRNKGYFSHNQWKEVCLELYTIIH